MAAGSGRLEPPTERHTERDRKVPFLRPRVALMNQRRFFLAGVGEGEGEGARTRA